jgi:hypothetical protein
VQIYLPRIHTPNLRRGYVLDRMCWDLSLRALTNMPVASRHGAGTVRGGRQQRQANEQSKQHAAQSAGAEMQQQSNQANAAYNKQMDTFKRGFSACMDARGYSVK